MLFCHGTNVQRWCRCRTQNYTKYVLPIIFLCPSIYKSIEMSDQTGGEHDWPVCVCVCYHPIYCRRQFTSTYFCIDGRMSRGYQEEGQQTLFFSPHCLCGACFVLMEWVASNFAGFRHTSDYSGLPKSIFEHEFLSRYGIGRLSAVVDFFESNFVSYKKLTKHTP